MVKFTDATFATPLHTGDGFTMGDAMLLASQMFVAMYVHELLYRAELSWVALLHHIGTVVMAEAAIAMTLMPSDRRVAGPEFMLCMVWGKFLLSSLTNLPDRLLSILTLLA
jgi:hypothetical protein